MTEIQSTNALDQNETKLINQFQVPRLVLILSALLSVVYFIVIAFCFRRGNFLLYFLLIAGEIFHLWQILTYLKTIWNISPKPEPILKHTPPVDVFVTVAGEPVEIVEKTIKAIKNINYPCFFIYILNDGFVAKKDNWMEIENLAKTLEVGCITRKIPGGAKAGNINNALNYTRSPLIAIFDADHVPKPEFLQETSSYFYDKKLAFVQTPQFYQNFNKNAITSGAWEQQELFFGPICSAKNNLGSAFMCGTNMLIRRTALIEAGGMCETNIAEDFLTSLFIHQNGWKSVYIPKILAEGLAPEDFLSYSKQQFRWARGSLEVIFKHNPLFKKGLNRDQKIQYLASASYYLSGPVILLNMLLPVIFFLTGETPLVISTMSLAAIFLPYIFLNVYILQISSNFSYTFRALSFSLGCFYIYIKALIAVLIGQKSQFSVTSKTRLNGNFLHLVWVHFLYILVVGVTFFWAAYKNGVNASILTNLGWAIFNVVVMLPFIKAAAPNAGTETKKIGIFQTAERLAVSIFSIF